MAEAGTGSSVTRWPGQREDERIGAPGRGVCPEQSVRDHLPALEQLSREGQGFESNVPGRAPAEFLQ